jgi:hypothetical protein
MGYPCWQQNKDQCNVFFCNNRRSVSIRAEAMTDLLNFAMLICASVGSMVFGILAAYGILRAGFALMRPQPRPVAVKTQPEAAHVS